MIRPLDSIVCFGKNNRLHFLGQSTKHLISREMEMKRVKLSEMIMKNRTATVQSSENTKLFNNLPVNHIFTSAFVNQISSKPPIKVIYLFIWICAVFYLVFIICINMMVGDFWVRFCTI